MWTTSLVLWTLVAAATAQIPSLGWCPDYQAMSNFNMNRFLGTWHEAERYFTVTELGSRCVTTTYERLPDGRVIVHNEIKNALTGVKRVIDGQLQHVGRDGEGKLSVKYNSLPLSYDTHYTILDTDYDTFAVMWSCSGIGPVHTQNAWVMTRDRLPPNLVLQRAYGVLDKFKISRAFFLKTGQEDCTIQPQVIEAIDPTPDSAAKPSSTTAQPDEPSQAVRSAEAVEDVPSEVEHKEKPEEEVPQEKAAPLSVADLIIPKVVASRAAVVEVENPVEVEAKEVVPAHDKVENVPEPNEVSESREAVAEEVPPHSEKAVEASQNTEVESIPHPESLKSLNHAQPSHNSEVPAEEIPQPINPAA